MDRAAQRSLSVGCARPRPPYARRTRARQGRQFPRAQVQTIANLGAYLSTFAPAVPTYLYGTLLAGTYRTPAIFCNVKAVFTNTAPVDAYRGAGRPEGLRRRTHRRSSRPPAEHGSGGTTAAKLHSGGRLSYQTPVLLNYDTGNYHATLDSGLKLADYQGFPARRAEATKHGKLRGIGLSTYIEACGIAPSEVAGALGARAGLFEAATIRVNPTGLVDSADRFPQPWPGHETTFAQVVAEMLGIPWRASRWYTATRQDPVRHGHLRIALACGRRHGNRDATRKIIDKGRRIAAHLLEASPEDIEFSGGRYVVRGTTAARRSARSHSRPMCRTIFRTRP